MKTAGVTGVFLGLSFCLSCSKYEEGPAMSVLTKKARLVNEWQPVKHVYSNGSETEATASEGHIEFTKDYSFVYTDGSGSVSRGTWDWVNHKESVRVLYKYTFGAASADVDEVFEIIRLKSNELWIKDDNGTITWYKEF